MKFGLYLFLIQTVSSMKKLFLLTLLVLSIACDRKKNANKPDQSRPHNNSAEAPYVKVINNLDPYARCIDGTSPALYIQNNTRHLEREDDDEDGNKKILIYMMGGALCGEDNWNDTLESCYQRSFTELGSGALWNDTLIGEGYLSTVPSKNRFASWTKVILTYCDGNVHQGSTKEPLVYKGRTMYFRGADITRSQFQWIQNHYDLRNAPKVVLTGGSAGGAGTFMWTNYLRTLVAHPENVYPIPDSGMFMDYYSPLTNSYQLRNRLINSVRLGNVDQATPLTNCNADHPTQLWKCFLYQYAYPYIQGKVLLIESGYDDFEIYVFLGYTNCYQSDYIVGSFALYCTPAQFTFIEGYRAASQNFLINTWMSNSNHSTWSISCSGHIYASDNLLFDVDSERVPAYTGLKVSDAVYGFVFNNQRINAIDTVQYPGNYPCTFNSI